ncbi:hypothetical protein, partial [Bacteroides heparinolyticus]|uniref:hypothetical protein n=1 Tax=Prevotella heparinolytica TaxID=28113 RepID=UPI0035A09F4F
MTRKLTLRRRYAHTLGDMPPHVKERNSVRHCVVAIRDGFMGSGIFPEKAAVLFPFVVEVFKFGVCFG